jgi:hypothetical protein
VTTAKKSDRLTSAPLPPSRASALDDDDGPEPMRLQPQRPRAGAIY